MRSEARLPNKLTLWFGPYTAIYTGGNMAYSSDLARVHVHSPQHGMECHGVAWHGVEWRGMAGGASTQHSAGATSGSDLPARPPHDLLQGMGVTES